MSRTEAPADPGPRKLSIVISAALAAFMLKIDTYIVNIALPTIARDFHVDTGVISWITMGYLMFLTGTLLLFGRLTDRLGVRRIFTGGYAVFSAASLLCGLSPSIGMIIAARCLQGVGASMLFVAAFSMIGRHVPGSSRGWAFGVVTTFASAGVIVGAPLGGIITGYLSWPWVFIVNVPVGVGAIVYALKTIPPDAAETREGGGSFDVAGTLTSMAGLFCLLFGLNQGHEMGWGSPVIVGAFIGALILGAAFFAWEARVREPLLEYRLFSAPAFRLAVTANAFGFLLLSGLSFMMPFYLEVVTRMSPQESGMFFLIYSAASLAVGPVAGRLSDRVRPQYLGACGMLVASAGCAVFAAILGVPGSAPAAFFLVMMGIAFALFISPNNNLVMGLAPTDRQGAASATFNTINTLSLVLGVLLFETILAGSIPSGIAQRGKSLAESAIPSVYVLAGFRNAFMAGALVTATSAFLSSRIPRTGAGART